MRALFIGLLVLCLSVTALVQTASAQPASAQPASPQPASSQQSSAASEAVVPPLINFSGALRDASGKSLTGSRQVSFSLYKESEGGAALWMETQPVETDESGQYNVMLGSTSSQGMPTALFTSGEARWLGIRIEGQEEQPRVLLVSVPYALKAGDAQTLGGLPSSAFALAPATTSAVSATGSTPGVSAARHTPSSGVTTAGGIVNTLPLFNTTTDIENSVVSQTGSGSSAMIGINTTPATTLDVNGNTTVRGNLTSNGFVNATTYELGGKLFAFGNSPNGDVFVGFAGNTASTGNFDTGMGIESLFMNSTGYSNSAYGGFALYGNTTGDNNTSVGYAALETNSTGNFNTADGYFTLGNNVSGIDNTAVGSYALEHSQTGSLNTAIGYNAGLDANSGTLSNTTAVGANATVSASNATAIGTYAQATAANSIVLGSINGTNGATADTNIGIAITAPTARLQIGVSNTTTGLRVEGPSNAGTGVLAGSFGGRGDFGIDAFGVVSGRFVVKENGNVGIGTSTPDSRLSVAGSADKTGGGSWGTYSDRRLKDLDGSFVSGLSQVLHINPVRYRYKEKNGMDIHDGEEHIGLVAQEVQSVIPEAVTENSKGYLLVNNDPIIWAMLNAIKEQQHQIEEQRRQIEEQRRRIGLQQRQLTHLNGKVQAVESAVRATKVASPSTANLIRKAATN